MKKHKVYAHQFSNDNRQFIVRTFPPPDLEPEQYYGCGITAVDVSCRMFTKIAQAPYGVTATRSKKGKWKFIL